jgi:hypothetical protein
VLLPSAQGGQPLPQLPPPLLPVPRPLAVPQGEPLAVGAPLPVPAAEGGGVPLASGDALPQLVALPKLIKLKIETVDISAADVEAIKAALPNCQVDFKPMTDAEKEVLLVKKLRL